MFCCEFKLFSTLRLSATWALSFYQLVEYAHRPVLTFIPGNQNVVPLKAHPPQIFWPPKRWSHVSRRALEVLRLPVDDAIESDIDDNEDQGEEPGDPTPLPDPPSSSDTSDDGDGAGDHAGKGRGRGMGGRGRGKREAPKDDADDDPREFHGRAHADARVELVHGSTITHSGTTLRFEAVCRHKDHVPIGTCKISRAGWLNGAFPGQGRCCGRLGAWVLSAHTYPTRDMHCNPFAQYAEDKASRLRARRLIRDTPGGVALLEMESKRDGDESEPSDDDI